MRKILMIMALAISSFTAYAKPHCQSFNNYDGKVTIVFIDDEAGDEYSLSSDVKLIPSKNGKEYKATSVSSSLENGYSAFLSGFGLSEAYLLKEFAGHLAEPLKDTDAVNLKVEAVQILRIPLKFRLRVVGSEPLLMLQRIGLPENPTVCCSRILWIIWSGNPIWVQ